MLFWAVGAAEKKNLNCHKYATFDVSFLYVFIAFFLNIVVSALKSYKFWQVFYFGLKQAKYFFWNKSAKHMGPESMISGDASWSGSNTAPSSLKGSKKNMLYIIEDNDILSHPD